jgi:hypothetical protein
MNDPLVNVCLNFSSFSLEKVFTNDCKKQKKLLQYNTIKGFPDGQKKLFCQLISFTVHKESHFE